MANQGPLPSPRPCCRVHKTKYASARITPGESTFCQRGQEPGRRRVAPALNDPYVPREHLRALGTPGRYHGSHALRHLAGARLDRATGDLYVVAALLGHAGARSTRRWTGRGSGRRWGSKPKEDSKKGGARGVLLYNSAARGVVHAPTEEPDG